MCRIIIKRWMFHSKVAIVVLLVLSLIPFILFSMELFYSVFWVGILVLRLYRFYSEKREKLIGFHTVLMVALWEIMYLTTGLRRKPFYLVLTLSLVYASWTYFADWWMEEQIAPFETVIIGNPVNDYPKRFHVIGTKSLAELIDFIDLYRVPVVLSDQNLGSSLMQQLSDMGVLVVISGYDTTFPRYEKLEFIFPAI